MVRPRPTSNVGQIRQQTGAAGLDHAILPGREGPAIGFEAALEAALHVEVPLAQRAVEAQRLNRNPKLDAPSAHVAGGCRFPDAVPVFVFVLVTAADQAVVPGAARIHRKRISRPAVAKRSEHDLHVILIVQIGVASDAAADDARRVVLALDADDERLGIGNHPHHGPHAGRGAFLRVGLKKRIGGVGRLPGGLIQTPIDVHRTGQGADA